MDSKVFYRRRLPHLTPLKGSFFVTFFLHGALPKNFLNQWEHRDKEDGQRGRRWFLFLERGLEQGPKGSYWLADPEVARIVYDAILHRDQNIYHLDCFTLMGNHVHMLFTPIEGTPLAVIMKSLKSFTGRAANKVLQRQGPFWHHEGFDRLVRSSMEWQKTIRYILRNPVKGGLVSHWQEWPWTWCAKDIVPFVLDE